MVQEETRTTLKPASEYEEYVLVMVWTLQSLLLSGKAQECPPQHEKHRGDFEK